MTARLVQILSAGAIALMLMYLVPDYLAWRDRYKDRAVIAHEKRMRELKKERAFLLENAKSEDERVLVHYWYDRDIAKEVERFRVHDGIDQYEAWMLASRYAGAIFRAHFYVHLPKRNGGEWNIVVRVMRRDTTHIVTIDASNGVIRSDGFPSVTDPIAFLRDPEMPNKAPEPTPGAVTPRATEGDSR